MKYENAYRSVLQFLESDVSDGFDLDDAQAEALAKRLVMRVSVDVIMQPEAVLPHAEALFLKPDEDYTRRQQQSQQPKQTRDEILKVCAKFFNVDANHPEKKTFWECVCPLNPPPITKDATVGSEINRKVFFTEVDKFVAAGKPIRIDVLTDIAACLSRANQLERYPAPAEPPPPPPSPQELAREQAKKLASFERALNDPTKSPIRGAKESAQPLIQPKAVLTEQQLAAKEAANREIDAIIAEAMSRVNGYSSYSHSKTYSGRAALKAVFEQAMNDGLSAPDVLRAVEAEASRLTDSGSIR